MNFYSLDGSKNDSNNLFGSKQIYERFDNTQNKTQNNTQNNSKSLDNFIDDGEEFASVPTTKSNATDNNYQCSDGYNVKGTTLNQDYNNVSLVDCKNMCTSSNTDCIGFNYDNSKKICTLKKDATALADADTFSTLCIKKSAGNSGCKVNNKSVDNNIKAFNELDSIFINQTNNVAPNTIQPNTMQPNTMQPNTVQPNTVQPGMDTNKYPMEIPSITVNKDIVEPTTSTNSNPSTNPNLNPNPNPNTTGSTNENKPNMGNNPSGVYVDLDCFMKNINVLQNHTDNMMIDLSLLLSNIKTCSYVKKTSSSSKVSSNPNPSLSPSKMNTTQLIEQITSKIDIPEPDVVKLKNIKADILITEPNSTFPTQLLEVSKEPFESNFESYFGSNTVLGTTTLNNWNYQDLVLIVILVILIYLLIFRE